MCPCPKESVNFSTTDNIYIEGDNLKALQLLQEDYSRKIKMIYIDPPYNTGGNFIYADNFTSHAAWRDMMQPRLALAADLLRDDGVIFISIDDHEVCNLRDICNNVFGEENFIAQLIWERAYAPKNDAKYISNSHEYILMYAKAISHFVVGRLPRTNEANSRYKNPDNDPRGPWKAGDLSAKRYTPADIYPIKTPSGKLVWPPPGRSWRMSEKAFLEKQQAGRIWFGKDGGSVPQIKRFLCELRHEGMAPQSILFYKQVGHSQEGTKEVAALLGANIFDGPKPVRLLNHLLLLANTTQDDIILDFFSGSGTTAHAVMALNAKDNGRRRFIMVQTPQPCNERSEAFKKGYKNVCEIGKERIRRAGSAICQPDMGFRVYKI